MTIVESSALAIVEGLTEYLPISSTGHIILTSALMGIVDDTFTQYFTVMVQFGAILAVMVEYFRFLTRQWKIYPVLFAAFLPAAVIGLSLNKIIDRALGSVWVVATSLFLGGIVLVFTDKIFDPKRARVHAAKDIDWKQGVKIGFFQCLALIPGMSRSAATIWGGLFVGMDQAAATEFSFLLALPTLTAATFYKGYKGFAIFTPDQWWLLLWGNILSFIVGWITIRAFIRYVANHSFKAFGYYRILVGGVTLLYLWLH
jgi:undecaprenyl-diphosphatase